MTEGVVADAAGAARRTEPVSALQIATVVLRARRVVVTVPVVAVLAALVVTLLLPRTYTSRASFVPQSTGQTDLSSFAGLSAQLGLGSLSSMSAFGSPELYRKLLQTETILGEIADSRFDVPRAGSRFQGTLGDFWRIAGATPERRRDAAVRKLREKMAVRVDPRIQLAEVEVTTTSPFLSKAVVERALELVSRFNQERRQSQSAQEARFTGARLQEARRALDQAEDAAARFMEANRLFRNSPALESQYERLQREVTLRQAVYTSLSQRYEQSRIEEVRDTPVLTLVERAQVPPRPDSRHLGLKLLVALVGGLVLVIPLALAWEFLARERALDEDELAAFRAALAAARADGRRPWRLLLGVHA